MQSIPSVINCDNVIETKEMVNEAILVVRMNMPRGIAMRLEAMNVSGN